MALVIYEVTDPLAMDFGLVTESVEYIKDQSIGEYFEDECVVFDLYKNQLELDYIPKDNETLIICYNVGDFGVSELVAAIIMMIVSTVISIAINMIFGPKEVDISDERPAFNSYLWGRGVTTSEAMIEIPIVLGRFPLYGNLIGAKSTSQVISQGVHTLYDNINVLYGLCSNPLDSIDTIRLNNIDAEQFNDEEVAVFYTKGELDQGSIRTFDDNSVSSNKVYRYGNLDNTPLIENELLLPDFTTEFYLDNELEIASHYPGTTTMKYDVLGKTTGNIVFLGVCDSLGNGEDPLVPSDDPLQNNLYIKVSHVSTENVDRLCSDGAPLDDTGLSTYSSVCSTYLETGEDYTDNTYTYQILTEEPFPTGDWILYLRQDPDLSVPYTGEYDESSYTGEDTEYKVYGDGLYVEKVLDLQDNISVLQVKSRGTTQETFVVGESGTKAPINTSTIYVSADWELGYTEPGAYILHTTTSSFGVEEIKLNILAPNGFFLRNVRQEHPVAYDPAWVSFGYRVVQYNGGNPSKAMQLVPTLASDPLPYPTGTLRPPTSSDISYGDIKYLSKLSYESFAFDINVTEIVGYSPREGSTNSEVMTYPESGTSDLLLLDSDGKLPAIDPITKQSYTYTVEVCQYSHGFEDHDHIYQVYYTVPKEVQESQPSKYTDDTQAELFIDLTLHRVTEINKDEALSYPGIPLVGISLNATEALNNSLPNLQVIANSKFRIYEVGQDITDPSSWTLGFTTNPALQVLSILYDTFYGAGLGGSEDSTTKNSQFNILVDIPKFLELAEYCEEPVENINGFSSFDEDPNNINYVLDTSDSLWKPKRYCCNGVLEKATNVWEVIIKILKVARANPVLIGTKISVVWEIDYDNTSQLYPLFSSTNIIKDSLTETFQPPTDYISKLTGSYYDEDNYFEQTAINLTLDASSTEEDTNKELNIDLFGITNRKRALYQLYLGLRENNYGRRIYVFKSSLPAYNLQVGDRISIEYELVDWFGANELTSGRILDANNTTKVITLDKDYPISSSVDKVLLSNKYNKIEQFSILSYTRIDGLLRLTLDAGSDITSYTLDDSFLVGESGKMSKDVIVLEINSIAGSLVEVKAYEYLSSMFEIGSYLITDFGISLFTKAYMVANNLSYSISQYTVTLTWSAPKILSNTSEDYLNKYPLILAKYIIFRRIRSNTENPVIDPSLVKWEQIGECETTWYIDNIQMLHIEYDYIVVPMFIFRHKYASIPRQWAEEGLVTVNESLVLDYLDVPDVEDPIRIASDDGITSDFKLTIKNSYKYTRDPSSEWFNIWCRESSNTDNTWRQTTDVHLVSAVKPYDTTITVNSIAGLPRSFDDATQVRGIFVINYNDVVFIDGSNINGANYDLIVKNAINTDYSTSLNIGLFHEAEESVLSRHHGFFPIHFFMTKVNNNVRKGLLNSSCFCDSLYVYHKNENYVKLYDATDSIFQTTQPQFDVQLKQFNDSYMWRVINTKTSEISNLTGARLTDTNATVFDFGEFSTEFSDLLFAKAGVDNMGTPVKLYSIFRGENSYGSIPATLDVDGNFKAHIKSVCYKENNLNVGIQHLIVDYTGHSGFTSFIKEI